MKRLLPALGALLIATGLAWAQMFKGPDVKPRGHNPTSNPQSFIISGAPVGSEVWAYPLAVNLLFPANFVGSSLDGYSGGSCGSNPSESDTYLFKCAGSTIGQVVLAGPSGAALVQQNTNTSGTASVVVALTNNVQIANTIIVTYATETTSFSPTFSLTGGSTATIGSFSTCPVSGTPVQDSSSNSATIVAYARVTLGGTLSITATVGSAEVQVMNVAEFSGVLSNPLDACGAGNTAGGVAGTSLNSGSSGGSGASDIIVASFGAMCGPSCTASLPAGYTALTSAGTTGQTVFGFFKDASAPQTVSSTLSTSAVWTGVALALKTTSGTACAPSFTTSNGQPQSCLANQRFEMDAPGTVSGANIGITIPAHTP